VAVTALLSLPAFAQSSSQLAFDVASVRVSSPGTRTSERITDTRVDIINMSMRSVLQTAFGLTASTDFRLAAPGWVDQTRIDIQATIPAGRVRRDVPEMLRTLLKERFGLANHIEPRPMEVYELQVDKGGLKMTEVPPLDELTKELERVVAANNLSDSVSETVDGPIRTGVITLGYRTTTIRGKYDRVFTERRTQLIDAARMGMTDLVSILTTTMDEPVIDKTGLTGLYQFRIELPPDAATIRSTIASGITTTVRGTPLTEPTGYSVFKALEGIGLNLEKRRSPVDVVVVDTLNVAPTPN
jgi:uncharacterized protein (TIGR03435 family)